MDTNKTYRTKQRQIILDFMRRNKGHHLSACEIMQQLQLEGQHVGQTTVYRTLEKLVDEGIVHRYAGAQGMGACYQYAVPDECRGNYHLVCSRCGKLIHIECSFLDELSEHIYNDHKFTLDRFKTVLYGVCEQCRQKESELQKEQENTHNS